MLVGNDSSIDILSYDAFYKMNIPPTWLRRIGSPLVDLSRDPIPIERVITLLVTKGS